MKTRTLMAALWLKLAGVLAAQSPGGAWVFALENDKFFAGTDRHYTQGAKVTHVRNLPPEGPFEAGFARWAGRVTARDFSEAKVAVSLGQDIFTPADIRTAALLPADRPYAAWLYGSLSLEAVSEGRSLTAEITVGMVGPAALGRQTQNGWHDIIGVKPALGWGNQLRNEPGLNLALDWRRRVLRTDWFDAVPRLALVLGNVNTHLSAGGTLRFGPELPRDFGPDLIRAGSGLVSDPTTKRLSGYLFVSANARAVARNIFLDGNTWQDNHSVSKRPVVADLDAGFTLRHRVAWGEIKSVRVTYAQNYRTKVFRGQPRGDAFGSLTVAFLF